MALTREHLRDDLRSGDVIEPAGYVRPHERMVRVVRDGRVVATVDYLRADLGGWLPEETGTCAEFR